MDEKLLLWRMLLQTIALANLLLLALLVAHLRPTGRRDPRLPMLLLAAGYTLGCAWRSLFPVFDVPRLVMLDAWPSSILLGRTVATVAELCFAAQWAWLLRQLGRDGDSRISLRAGQVLLPLILLAELCSWTAVLSTSNLGHVAEESLWALAAGCVLLALLALRQRLSIAGRPLLSLAALLAAVYLGYLLAVDVPGYWARWQAELAAGHRPLGLLEGLQDAATRRELALRWSDWRGEVIWISLYFSVGVWVSLALALLPPGRSAARPAAPRVRPAVQARGATR